MNANANANEKGVRRKGKMAPEKEL